MFDGRQILKPEELEEVDTDLSSVLKINGHAETIQKIFDVVKKTAYGVDFMIWGLENQDNVHYAMPLRHMLNDSLAYLKECNEIISVNRKEKRKLTFSKRGYNYDIRFYTTYLQARLRKDKQTLP